MLQVAELCEAQNDAVPTEFADLAYDEVMALTADQPRLRSVSFMPLVRQAGQALAFNVLVDSPEAVEELYREAPSAATILESMRGYAGGAAIPFFGGFTLNIAQPGEVIPKHRDIGSENYDRRSDIATLSGIGTFTIISPTTGEPTELKGIGVGAVTSFENPGATRQRALHFAQNTGDNVRVTIGAQTNLRAAT